MDLTDRIAPAVGLEPTTVRLTVECSAIELRGIATGNTLTRSRVARKSVEVSAVTQPQIPRKSAEFRPYPSGRVRSLPGVLRLQGQSYRR